ncbi:MULTISPECIES: hypothetical protein [unclassified Serratia (in: enterobacteria)]|uniref:hypothetical protein n=1 Tax=unclassified Serratia (in: enterobacteria) TaxID=2647522 RepID=UPI000469975F|nr:MULTISPECIES: hypothetical protein [unclassified Serratia (in: enterobacteria)]
MAATSNKTVGLSVDAHQSAIGKCVKNAMSFAFLERKERGSAQKQQSAAMLRFGRTKPDSIGD